jgi:hypothetical protein
VAVVQIVNVAAVLYCGMTATSAVRMIVMLVNVVSTGFCLAHGSSPAGFSRTSSLTEILTLMIMNFNIIHKNTSAP